MLAQSLVIFEAAANQTQAIAAASVFWASERLRQPLSSVAGSMAFHALLSRALILTKAEFPRLQPAKLDKNGCVEGFSDIIPPLDKKETAEAEVTLIGNMVELLCTFLGEALALRLIQGVWPEASFVDEKSEKEERS